LHVSPIALAAAVVSSTSLDRAARANSTEARPNAFALLSKSLQFSQISGLEPLLFEPSGNAEGISFAQASASIAKASMAAKSFAGI